MNIKFIISNVIRYMVIILQYTNLTLYHFIISLYDYKRKLKNEKTIDKVSGKKSHLRCIVITH